MRWFIYINVIFFIASYPTATFYIFALHTYFVLLAELPLLPSILAYDYFKHAFFFLFFLFHYILDSTIYSLHISINTIPISNDI